jgi:hypothetical protein
MNNNTKALKKRMAKEIGAQRHARAMAEAARKLAKKGASK